MSDFFQKLHNAKSEIRLDEEQKNRIRGQVFEFMERVPQEEKTGFRTDDVKRAYALFSFFSHPMFKPAYGAVVVLSLVLTGGGLSYAAEGALPGDALYPVKVRINEEVRAVLSISPEAKAEWEARRVERRLDEAARLVLRGYAKEGAHMALKKQFKKDASRVEERITRLEVEGDDQSALDIASRLETSLRGHGQVLVQIEDAEHKDGDGGFAGSASSSPEETGEAKSQVSDLSANSFIPELKKELRGVAKTRLLLESKIEKRDGRPDAMQAAENKLAVAKNIIVFVKIQLEERGGESNASTSAEIESRITEAERLSAEASAKIEAGAYGEAFALGNKIFRIVQELRVFFEVQNRIRVNVHFKDGAFVGDEEGGEVDEDGENDKNGENGESDKNGESGEDDKNSQNDEHDKNDEDEKRGEKGNLQKADNFLITGAIEMF